LKDKVSIINLLYSSTNQELFEKCLRNQSNHQKNMEDFHCKKAIMCKSTLFTSAKMKGIQKDTGKSMKNALFVLRYANVTSLAEVTSNSKKIKPIAVAIVELWWGRQCTCGGLGAAALTKVL